MNRIAFVMGEHFLYWHSIILTLSILTAICMFFALMVRSREDGFSAVPAVPLAFFLSLVFSRLIHWYCRPQGYAGLLSALTDYSRGSFALIGVFAGCLLTAVLLRLLGICRNLPRMLDCMSIAGALGISTGRLSSLFTTADRGMLLPDFVPFPLASRLTNSVSGGTEVRLAVFLIQALIAGILFWALLCFWLRGRKKDGDTCLLFLLWYCGSQAVLDSTRYDSIYFRSNGFVSVVQIFSVVTVLVILGIFTVRLIRCRRWKKLCLPFLTLPLLGLAGYMEYHVQRHGGQALFAYTVMSLSMLGAVLLILGIRACAVEPRQMAPRVQEYRENTWEEEENQIPRQPVRMPPVEKKRRQGRYQGKFSSR